MWTSDDYRNQVSILALIASDASYEAGGLGLNSRLRTAPDSTPADEYPFYEEVLTRMGVVDDVLSPLAYEVKTFDGVEGVELKNWRQEGSAIEHQASGAAAIIYRRDYAEAGAPKSEYIVAFRGSDGRNGRDWFSNIQLGKDQWAALAAELYGPSGRIGALVSPDGAIPRIHFTGQSLGGGLAQYAAYEYVRQRDTRESALFSEEFHSQRSQLVTLTTFNSFAAGLGLTQLYDGEKDSEIYDPSRLNGIPTAHYSIENEIVHNLGGRFVGDTLEHGFLNATDSGQSNLYHFASWRHWTEEGVERKDDPQGYLGLVEGHRIETGFYQGLDRYDATFSSAVQGGDPTGLVRIDRLQQVGEIFARFLGGDRSGEFASWARITAAVAMGAVFGGVGDVARLLQLVGNSLYKSEHIGGFTRAIIASGIGSRFSASTLVLLAKPAVAVAAASSLVAAIADLFQNGDKSQEAAEVFNRNTSAENQLVEVTSVGINNGSDAVSAAESMIRLGFLVDLLQPGLLAATPLASHADAVIAAGESVLDFTHKLYGAQSGYGDALGKLTTEVARTSALANRDLISFGRDLVEHAAVEGTRIAAANTEVKVELSAHIAEYADDLSAAFANLGGELLPEARNETPIVLAPAADYHEFRSLIDQLRKEFGGFDAYELTGLSEEAAPALAERLSSAHANLTAAGQAVEIRVFAEKPANPFDDAAFDPGADAAASNEIAAGSAGTYVVFLPYEATEGGQRIALKLGGAGVDKVEVWSEGVVVPVVDGIFTLNVAEGRRQVAFALEAADDLDASGAVSIGATLVDENDVATHQAHVEANVALKHEDQSFETIFDAASATDFSSADRVSGYFSQGGVDNDPTQTRTQLVGTDRGDFVVADHASESVAGGGGNDFILEQPGSGRGTYVGADSIDGGSGNDFITGHLGTRVDAGAGDDFVNANFAVHLGASRQSQTLPDFPAEIYADIADFVRAVPTGAGPVANADGSLDFAYVRDFGDSNIGNPIAGVSAKMGIVATDTGPQVQRTATGGAAFQFTTFNGVGNITYFGAGTVVTYGVAFESSAALGNMDAVMIDGHDGNDQLSGAGGFDFIQGGTGNDRIGGFGGDDTLEGEEGQDQIIGGSGDDYMDGGAGDDRLWGEGGHDGLWGGAGNDMLFGDALSTPLALQGDDYLDGGAGNDDLTGGGGRDELFGGEGDDVLEGGEGEDYLDGEAGNDTLIGGAGDDVLLGGEGVDVLNGGDGADVLYGELGVDQIDGGTGNDRLYGGRGNDQLTGGLDDDLLNGGSGADQLLGGAGADSLDGGAGADRLVAGEGADTLIGGAGDNLLAGEAGDDIYVLALGDGLSVIDDLAGTNRIVYGYGIFADDVTAAYTDPAAGPQDLVLTYGSSRVSIRGGGNTIASLGFADGTFFDLGQFLAQRLLGTYERKSNVLIGTVGNDTLADISGADVVAYGLEGSDAITTGSGADALHGGPGNDSLNGGAGNDTYHFSRGDGQDRITDVDTTPGNVDAVVYGADIEASQVLVSRSINDLVLTLAGTSERVTVAGYFQNDGATPNSVEEIRFLSAATVWDVETVKLKAIAGTAGNDVLTGYASDDTMAGGGGNDVVQGAGGADVLDGGAGNDTLRGGTGDDTYVFGRGDGIDVIDEETVSNAASGLDTIVLREDVSPAQVQLRRITDRNLELRLDDGSILTVERQFTADGALAEPIERIRFASDGTVWDLPAISQIIAMATPGDDFLWGTPQSDTLAGGAGDDWLQGGRGSDVYQFGAGDGHDLVLDNGAFIFGGEIDRLVFGVGITPADVSPTKQILFGVYPSLVLNLDTGDSISLVNYFGTSLTSTPYLIEEIGFEDGTVWTDETIAEHFPIFGSPSSEILGGSLIADVIYAGDGSDIVTSRSGNDVVYGGPGHDRLEGGDDDDQLYGEAGNDTLNGGVNWPRPGNNLLDGGQGDDILDGRSAGRDLLLGGEGNDRYLFGLGSGIDTLEDFDSTPGNADAIVLNAGIVPAHLTGWHTASHRILALNDLDQLHIRWDPAAGVAIERVQFGDGTAWDAAALLEHTATPLATNQPPSLHEPLADQIAWEDMAFTFAMPAAAFVDPDAGDTLAYAASLADGSPLPPWLSFDPATRVFSGTPTQDDVGAFDVQVTAVDAEGAAASDVFVVSVANVNDAPYVAVGLADHAVDAEMPFAFSVPAGTFVDVDAGELLALSASLPDGVGLPAWVEFDAASGRFSGMPTEADMGIIGIAVLATDASGASARSEFALTVRAVAGSSVTGGSMNDVIVGSTGDEVLSGGAGDDALLGGLGDDVLRGGRGEDVLQGGDGKDVLHAGPGDSLLDGGAGDDVIFGGSGASIIIGGKGNDIVRTGSGDDIIAFNQGDGWDTVFGNGDGDNTVSLGGGIDYADLSFSRSENDLLLHTGNGEGMLFKDWYAGNKSVLNLQIVLDAIDEFDAAAAGERVQTFDFGGLVRAFEEAQEECPGLTRWQLTNALLEFHLWSSDDEALGGDLAYWYARNRGLSGLSLLAAQQVLGDERFGSDAQSLRPFSGLQEGLVKLG